MLKRRRDAAALGGRHDGGKQGVTKHLVANGVEANADAA
jgi:hypothetical protein